MRQGGSHGAPTPRPEPWSVFGGAPARVPPWVRGSSRGSGVGGGRHPPIGALVQEPRPPQQLVRLGGAPAGKGGDTGSGGSPGTPQSPVGPLGSPQIPGTTQIPSETPWDPPKSPVGPLGASKSPGQPKSPVGHLGSPQIPSGTPGSPQIPGTTQSPSDLPWDLPKSATGPLGPAPPPQGCPKFLHQVPPLCPPRFPPRYSSALPGAPRPPKPAHSTPQVPPLSPAVGVGDGGLAALLDLVQEGGEDAPGLTQLVTAGGRHPKTELGDPKTAPNLTWAHLGPP